MASAKPSTSNDTGSIVVAVVYSCRFNSKFPRPVGLLCHCVHSAIKYTHPSTCRCCCCCCCNYICQIHWLLHSYHCCSDFCCCQVDLTLRRCIAQGQIFATTFLCSCLALNGTGRAGGVADCVAIVGGWFIMLCLDFCCCYLLLLRLMCAIATFCLAAANCNEFYCGEMCHVVCFVFNLIGIIVVAFERQRRVTA